MNPSTLAHRWTIAAALGLSLLWLSASAGAQSRGELLYATHCIACHTQQVHWRDGRQATDWPGLKAQVTRWQATLGLRWTDQDVVEVARYLNDSIYRFEPRPEQSRAPTDRRRAQATLAPHRGP